MSKKETLPQHAVHMEQGNCVQRQWTAGRMDAEEREFETVLKLFEMC